MAMSEMPREVCGLCRGKEKSWMEEGLIMKYRRGRGGKAHQIVKDPEKGTAKIA